MLFSTSSGTDVASVRAPYLFLWRLAFRRFRYLCLDIFARRFFLMEPTFFLLEWQHCPLLGPCCGFCSKDDFVERQLDDACRTCGTQGRDDVTHDLLLNHGFDGEPTVVIQLVDGRSMQRGKNSRDSVQLVGRDIELDQHARFGSQRTLQQKSELLNLGTFLGVLPCLLVRYQARGGGENGVDDTQVVSAQGGARLSSTMASTSSGALTSVAPQENSTSASTPCWAR